MLILPTHPVHWIARVKHFNFYLESSGIQVRLLGQVLEDTAFIKVVYDTILCRKYIFSVFVDVHTIPVKLISRLISDC